MVELNPIATGRVNTLRTTLWRGLLSRRRGSALTCVRATSPAGFRPGNEVVHAVPGGSADFTRLAGTPASRLRKMNRLRKRSVVPTSASGDRALRCRATRSGRRKARWRAFAMPAPERDRATDRLSNPDSRSAERPAPARRLLRLPSRRRVCRLGADKTPWRRGRRTRRPARLRSRVRFRPQVGFLEQRALLSALPTLTALMASTASAAFGQSVTFTATVSDLSPGGATPNGGTVTFSDQSGAIGSATLVDGVAEFTTSSLAAGTTRSRPPTAAPRTSPRAPRARS